ncbi:hypothetical protein Sjap_020603 [Stephania japonica]|uniref:Short-chain dehydrogenase/reductase n=1 Tax=Stephania japonica TaxID=461633 RepID=A0AAP0I0T6_9MAGN
MAETASNLAQNRYAVVTGGNKGIGFEICRQLASRGIMVILAARDETRGVEAVANLKSLGVSNVVFHQLDTRDPTSVASFANYVKINFRKLDILVNNAGCNGLVMYTEAYTAFIDAGNHVTDDKVDSLKGIVEQTYEKAEECVGTNYFGTKRVTEALLPLLQLSDSPRIVNLSSIFSQLKFIPSEKIRAEMNNVECLKEERLDELMQQFLKDFKEDKLLPNGWPLTVSAYKVSKAAINAYTRILAKKFPNFRINSNHPGYVITDITCNRGLLTPEEGAERPVMLALLPDNGPSGFYFDQMEISSF